MPVLDDDPDEDEYGLEFARDESDQAETYRTCLQCGRDCLPEAFSTSEGMRIAFACQEHGVHTVVEPFGEG